MVIGYSYDDFSISKRMNSRVFLYAVVFIAVFNTLAMFAPSIMKFRADGAHAKDPNAREHGLSVNMPSFAHDAITESGAIVEIARRHNIRQGYCGRYISASLNFITNDEIRIAPVDVTEFTAMPYNQSIDYYHPDYSKKKTFLVLFDFEESIFHESEIGRNILDHALERNEITGGETSFAVYVLEYNPFIRLRTLGIGQPLTLYPAAPYMKRHGFDKFGIDGKSVISNPDLPRNVLFGPYMRVKRGTYEARIHYKILNDGDFEQDQKIGVFEVRYDWGRVRSPSVPLLNGHDEALLSTIDFEDEIDTLELCVDNLMPGVIIELLSIEFLKISE